MNRNPRPRPAQVTRINGLALALTILLLSTGCARQEEPPGYLSGYAGLYREDPRKANLAWFRDADFGLFIHYGLYSLLERGEWVQLRDTIPVSEYAGLMDRFTADKFDADRITDIALDAGMKYITLTSKHHDGFALFETSATEFSAPNSPAARDLVGELYDACREKGLGLFLYYSYAADWKHPWFYSREGGWKNARPAYPETQPEYRFKEDEDFSEYIGFVHTQLTELLTQYPEIAGIWLDPIMGYYHRPDLFPVDSTYALIRSLSPHALISFKQGANGTEDFIAPERHGAAQVGRQFDVARKARRLNQGKPVEICNTLQPHAWGYHRGNDGRHKSADEVMGLLAAADSMDANLLLNVGPRGDGSFPEEDIRTLREVGRRLRAGG